MYRVMVYREHVYEYSPDLTLNFETLEEAEMFKDIVFDKAEKVTAVHIDMDRKIYGPKEEEK